MIALGARLDIGIRRQQIGDEIHGADAVASRVMELQHEIEALRIDHGGQVKTWFLTNIEILCRRESPRRLVFLPSHFRHWLPARYPRHAIALLDNRR